MLKIRINQEIMTKSGLLLGHLWYWVNLALLWLSTVLIRKVSNWNALVPKGDEILCSFYSFIVVPVLCRLCNFSLLRYLRMIYILVMNIYRGVFRTQTNTSKMEHFAKIVNGFQPLTIFAKSFILDVRLGSKFTSELQNQYSQTCRLTFHICANSLLGGLW